ncbi:UNVERIFIED_CONTAM: Pentatricopeptide repeat-containing protein [Sesamum radiatum]|uniref:Pentatricopeptide repeat-containing protein n=1 Tax=Sesamum radiatum TaxID=300843 RepID=A0AAW2KNZ1_SESRA
MHSRQKHRQYLGSLLLSPPQNIGNPVLYCRTVHAQIILSGFESNLFLSNILITAYSRRGALGIAATLFARMPEKNLISWSSIISAYNRDGNNAEALMLFREFRRSGYDNPNEFVLATVVQSCTELASAENGMYLHSFVIKAGCDQNAHVGTSLIDFYAKTSDLDAARLVFDELGVKSIVTWTAIILGCFINGRSDLALDLFKQMVGSGIVPDKYALSSVLAACSMLELLEMGKQVHAFVLRSGADTDVSVSNVLIDFYSKCGELKAGHIIFGQMMVKNTISWTMMISGYMQSGFHYEAMDLYKDMNRSGRKADAFACSSVLTSCGSVGALNEGKQVHAYTMKIDLDSDDFVTNSLIDMYCKCDSLIDAMRVFLASERRTAICYNVMIEGYSRQERLYDALHLFNQMRHNLLQPSLLSFVSLLGASASQTALEVSRQIHSLMIKSGFCLDSYCGSALIDAYSKCSFVGDARLVFEEIIEKDIVVWNSMLFGYALQSEHEKALRLYLELQHGRERPNASTYVAVIMASTKLASLSNCLQFHNQAIKTGLDFDPFVTNALMDMYAKCGCIDTAQLLFKSISQRDIVCWNSMISMHAQHGNAEKALQTFTQMRTEGIKPNYITFIGVLTACAHVGLVEEGFHHFESMSEFGIEPGEEHYTCMVSLLGRAGKLYEAKSFIDKMPIQPTALVWKSLLGACRVTGNVELAQHAAEMAISSDPTDSGSYTLLSNIFASKGMWTDVKKVREKMDKNYVVKETGCSWIEINDQVHLFFARDRTHQQADLINHLVDHLIQHMKGIDHEPDSPFYHHNTVLLKTTRNNPRAVPPDGKRFPGNISAPFHGFPFCMEVQGTCLRPVKRKHEEFEDENQVTIPGIVVPQNARVEIGNECMALRETVSSQQQTIQDLISELEEERNASSSAANEAMSMILRLQRDKAEIQMEARQFKRFAEEKMAHDQQETSGLEDLLYKRDQVIQSLTCEVQAYKHRMMSYGITEAEASVDRVMSRNTSMTENLEGIDLPLYEIYPPLKCNPNESQAYPDGDYETPDIEKYAFGETPRSRDQLKDLECRINLLERSPRAIQPDGEFIGTKNVLEKVIVGHSPRSRRHLRKFSSDSRNSFFAMGREIGPDFARESPKYDASFKKTEFSYIEENSNLRKLENVSEIEDDLSDRVYTIDSVYQGASVNVLMDRKASVGIVGDEYMATPRESMNHSDVSDIEIQKLYARLHALEADRESMRQAIISIGTDKAQMVLLKEIAQNLCHEMSPARRMPERKQSMVGKFSIMSIFKDGH